MTTTAQHNHPQLSASPAEAPALQGACPGAGQAAGTPTSTVLNLQPWSNSSRANNRALSHGQGEWKDRDGSRAGTEQAAGQEHCWAEENQPAHAPAPCQQLPLPLADWHISAFKGMFWAVGTRGKRAISVQWLLAKPLRGVKWPAVRAMCVWERAALASKAQRQWPIAKVSFYWLPGSLYQPVQLPSQQQLWWYLLKTEFPLMTQIIILIWKPWQFSL